MDFTILASIAAGAFASAVACTLPLRTSRRRPGAARPAEPTEHAVFLLNDGEILNGTPSAWEMLDMAPGAGDWRDLHAAFHRRFPNLPTTVPSGNLRISACDGSGSVLAVEQENRQTRLTIDGPPPTPADLHQMFLLRDELDLLRTAMATAPHPIWQCDENGAVLWFNAAYGALCARVVHTDLTRSLFDVVLPQTEEPARTRTSVSTQDGQERFWFEVCSVQSSETWLNYAADIDAVMRAETAQRNFVQTLTKTFAHLPIGLAVFDRDRRLVLFNPALIDLTHLPADFLSRRPNLLSFFDNMRDNRMMPEPKNYANWRQQMADLVAAASDDRYAETWSLPSGLTYKITGRPHPDGAIAFLLEDISSEITLTRRFRSELDLSQSVLDSIDDAVVVFSPVGVLSFCNAAYRTLWNCDPDSAFSETTVNDSIRQWQSACSASPIWGEIRDFVLTLRERAAWDATLMMGTDTNLVCHVEPVSGGATLVRFSQILALSDTAEPARLRVAGA